MADNKPKQHIEYKDSTHIGDNVAGDVYRQTVKPRTITAEQRERALAVPRSQERRVVAVTVQYGGSPAEEYEFGMALSKLLSECDFQVRENFASRSMDLVVTGRPPLTGTVLTVNRGGQVEAVLSDLQKVLEVAGVKYELLPFGGSSPIEVTVLRNPLEYEQK